LRLKYNTVSTQNIIYLVPQLIKELLIS